MNIILLVLTISPQAAILESQYSILSQAEEISKMESISLNDGLITIFSLCNALDSHISWCLLKKT